MNSKKLKKNTFVINIIDTQHYSWQGEIIWTQTNKKEYFRSALELISLIDSALREIKEKV